MPKGFYLHYLVLNGGIITDFSFFFWLCRVARGILVPRPGIEPTPPAMQVQSLNHWTSREVLISASEVF